MASVITGIAPQSCPVGSFVVINGDVGCDNFLVSTIALIARFWISEAAISFKNVKE